MTQSQFKNAYRFVAVGVFLYLFVRSITVPISHDEAATFFHYIQSGSFIPYHTLWDANNHFLNSLLTYPAYKLLGSNLLWLRLPNLLFFPVYAFFVYKLTAKIPQGFVKILTAVALLTTPYILEFFAQCRGYGMSIALLMGALWYVHLFWNSGQARHQLYAWIFLVFALMANMALMNTFLIVLSLITLFAILNFKKFNAILNWVYLLGFGYLPFLAAAKYSFEMKERGLLYYGKTESFISVTVQSLLEKEFLTHSGFAAWTVSIIGVVAGVGIILPFIKDKFRSLTPGALAALLMFGNAAGAILLNLLMGVNFPQDRIAMYFIPLFILTFGYFASHLAQKHLPLRYVASLLVVFPLTFIVLFNFSRTLEWELYPVSHRVFEHFKAQQLNSNEPLIISGDRLLEMSWGYHNVRSNQIMPPFAHNYRDSLFLSDYVLCHPSNCTAYNQAYTTVYEDPSRMKLLKRNSPLHLKPVYELPDPIDIKTNQEFINILDTENPEIISTANLLELEISFSSQEKPLNMDLVITSSNSNNPMLFYDFIPIKWIRNEWHGDTLKLRRPLDIPQESERFFIYIWNIEQARQETTISSVKLYRASAP